MAVLGIDLGTTNSVVCVVQNGEVRVLPDKDGNLLIPSIVSFHPGGDILVGHPARERRLLDAKNTIYSVKRLIGRPYKSPEVRRAEERFPFEVVEGPTQGVLVRARGETYTLPEISAFVLREVKTIAEAQLREACPQAVVTVPANFNELQRSATKAAGRVAGLEVLRILNEPTAAALAYGYGQGSRERIAVFDLGGGTFDITILELAGDVFEVLATAGDTFLGGDDFDLLVADKMADAFLQHHRFDPRTDEQAFERLRAAAEWAKCQLSSQAEVQLRVEELAYGDAGTSLDLTFGMTRAALEGLIRPLVARAFDVCEDAMRVAGLRPTQLDNVVLVGGSTRIPMVRAMVQEYFGRAPLGHIDPDLVVARGAALQAAALTPQDNLSKSTIGRVALKKASLTDIQPVVSEVVTAPQVEIRGQPKPPPPPPEAARKKQPVAPGGSTLGFGSSPLPAVVDDSWMPSLPPPTGHQPLVQSAPPPPPLPHPAPLLLDVTPHTLGVETVGGFCEPVIARNAAIPVEQTRIFTTGQDDQAAVAVRIYQGEARKLGENQLLGTIELSGLRPAARGQVKIGVTFMMDADGTLGVRAKDLETGHEQSVRVNLAGGLGEQEIAAMAARQAKAVGR